MRISHGFALLTILALFTPGRAMACPGGPVTVGAFDGGFVYAATPYGRNITVVRGTTVNEYRVPALGVRGQVSPDGRWLATVEVRTPRGSSDCTPQQSRIVLFELSRRPRRRAMRWRTAEEVGQLHAMAFSANSQTLRVQWVGTGVSEYRYALGSGRPVESGPTAVDDAARLPTPAAPTEVLDQAGPITARRDTTTQRVRIEASTGQIEVEGAHLERVVFSPSGARVMLAYRNPEAEEGGSGFRVVDLHTGRVQAERGAALGAAPSGQIPVDCGLRAEQTTQVRATASAYGAPLGELAPGQKVQVISTEAGWTRIASPSGWVHSEHLARRCLPVVPDP